MMAYDEARRISRTRLRCAGAFPNAVLAAALWQFALVSYIGLLVNLNPLMEFDGYYILSDLLEKPNLRPRALAWLGQELLPALRDPARLRGHRLELLYGLSSVLYVAFSAALVVALAVAGVLGELRGVRAGPGSLSASHVAAHCKVFNSTSWRTSAMMLVVAVDYGKEANSNERFRNQS